jgi:predicted N-acetyltransferase YhbS
VKLEIADADPAHAAIVEDLARRAFAGVRRGARPDQGAGFIAHLLGPSNPAGVARVALAHDAGAGGRALGSLVAIPARFRRRDGRVVTGYQVGYFFVDHRGQGQGVGTALLAGLTAALRSEPDSFVYTFPNPRSIGHFDRFGYERVASIPTYLYPPAPVARGDVRDAAGREWTIESVGAAAAARVAATDVAPLPPEPGFTRDVEHFAWRYCGPESGARYRFAVCRARDGGEVFVAVLARHRLLGAPFTVLVDVLSADLACHYVAAVRVAGRARGRAPVYANTNLARAARRPPGLPVPRLVNPRPVELLKLPGEGGVSRAELAGSVVITGDWLGF